MVLDEVHERFVEADFLMALLRLSLSRPGTLRQRVVVMSATLQKALGNFFRRGVSTQRGLPKWPWSMGFRDTPMRGFPCLGAWACAVEAEDAYDSMTFSSHSTCDASLPRPVLLPSPGKAELASITLPGSTPFEVTDFFWEAEARV